MFSRGRAGATRTKAELMEERYLVARDENQALKKKVNEQQLTIKRMMTKVAIIEENLKRKGGPEAAAILSTTDMQEYA